MNCLWRRAYSTTSTKQWIQRQTSDHFVQQAHRQSLRSRASFKLLDLLKTHPFLIRKGNKVLDLGAAPGGWSQVAVEAVSSRGIAPLAAGARFVGASLSPQLTNNGDSEVDSNLDVSIPLIVRRSDNGGRVIAVDLLSIDPIPGATVLTGDMTLHSTQEKVVELCGGRVDVVLSDMAHSFTGSRSADVARVLDLCRTAFSVAERVLKPEGNFVCKFIRGEDDQDLHKLLQSRFESVFFDKPLGSRTGSAEAYLICLNYKPPVASEVIVESTESMRSDKDENKQPSEAESKELFHPGPKINQRSSRPIPLNEIDTQPRAKPRLIPHWSQLKPGTKVRVLLISDLKGKPVGRGVSNAGPDKLVNGVVEILLSRDYHRSGVKVRLTDGRIGRVCEVFAE
ncbi:UNVERIFIED_CONTAM: hypothetical protein HDU68_007889 [Siphonaria sp. JEL0065]|nr:hypothetical protein HDU68_007889 [Siphonaria sp. JEL0065]